MPAFAQSFLKTSGGCTCGSTDGKCRRCTHKLAAAKPSWWCEWRTRTHTLRRWNLNPVRLPIPPHSLTFYYSGLTAALAGFLSPWRSISTTKIFQLRRHCCPVDSTLRRRYLPLRPDADDVADGARQRGSNVWRRWQAGRSWCAPCSRGTGVRTVAANRTCAAGFTIAYPQMTGRPVHDLGLCPDVVKNGTTTFGRLLDYCRRSANPVGRLMLALIGVGDPQALSRQ